MLVKFSTLGGGVFIEVTESETYQARDKCFRFMRNGFCEYTFYEDLISNPNPPWFNSELKYENFYIA